MYAADFHVKKYPALNGYCPIGKQSPRAALRKDILLRNDGAAIQVVTK